VSRPPYDVTPLLDLLGDAALFTQAWFPGSSPG